MSWGYIGAAAVTAVAGAVSQDKAAKAARSAAQTQKAAADRAAATRQAEQAKFETRTEQARLGGLRAQEQQQALLGLSGTQAQEQAFQQFRESPGQAFLRQRGEQALLRQSAALGGLGGGQVRSALQQQGIGFAQQDLQNQLARLSGIAGQGQAATAGVANLGAGVASGVGQLGLLGAQAQAAGTLGQAAAQSRFAGQLGGSLSGLLVSRQQTGEQVPQQTRQAPALGSGQVTSQPSVFNQQQQTTQLGKL